MKKRLLSLLLSLLLLVPTAGALTLEQARELVEKLYVYDVPEEVINRATVEEIFAGLDTYSSYFTPEGYKAFLESMNDVSKVGLGLVSRLSEDRSSLEIAKVLSGGAAEKAGIQVGDAILSIDGRWITEASSLEEAGGWMRGEEGTLVTLTLKRADGQTKTLTVTRAPYIIPYTEYELVDGHIGYLSCQSFGAETYGHFVDALDKLGPKAQQWIVDLRGNTGGVAQAAADVAGIFNGSGTQGLLEQKGPQVFAFAAKGERTTLYPAILLVDGQTASASELLAAAIRDGGSGLIIGSRTFGKGVAQTVVDQSVEPDYFPDGDAVRVTSARFYSPEGITNDRMGVLPHLMVEDQHAGNIAYLLCGQVPDQNNKEYLRIHTGSWRWYVSLDQALKAEDGAYRPAFVELLEALWPETVLYLGTGGRNWEEVSAAEVAQRYKLEEYTPRTFTDAEQSSYPYELNVLGTYGMLQGDEKGMIHPEQELTRADLCAMLAQTLNLPQATWPARFSDVPQDAWYANAVNAIAAMGFVDGDGGGRFHPEEVLTGEQLVVIMSRFATWLNLGVKMQALAGPEEGMLTHTYLMDYSDWAKESAWLMGMARQNIYGDYISYVYTDIHKIAPQAPATREQAGASLYRILELMGGFVP